jgi:SAM-dependent methyltransferase
VDLGCGSGLWAREAVKAGFEVIGVDISPAMIRLAKRIAPRARFQCAAAGEFDFPPCVAVTAIGEAFNYMHGRGSRPPDLGGLFRWIAEALQSGGLLMFDMILREGKPMNYGSWQQGKDWATLVEVSEDRGKQTLTRRVTSFRKRGAGYHRGEETHRLWVPSQAEVGRLLKRAGFGYQARRSYGSFPLPVRRWAFVARR